MEVSQGSFLSFLIFSSLSLSLSFSITCLPYFRP
jgi:hypothetical protein